MFGITPKLAEVLLLLMFFTFFFLSATYLGRFPYPYEHITEKKGPDITNRTGLEYTYIPAYECTF
jgi:hypothetical protein